jgi:hypothetical protein
MSTSVFELIRKHSSKKPQQRRARPALEGLEDRQLLTVTYHGGAVLGNVEVQALYLGSDWANDPNASPQISYLENYLSTIVDSSYMDMLTTAGYNVGRGSYDPGVVGNTQLDSSQYLTNDAIQGLLQSYINSGDLVQPDSNRLYVVIVEPNVAVSLGGANSQKDFLGFHNAFGGTDASGNPQDIRYAVITYPGGDVQNGALPYLSALDQLTSVTSHELAEAVTDPDVNYKTLGWNDDSASDGEIGDFAAGHVVSLDGYVVQRIVDQNDQEMTPAGATAITNVSFVLQGNGNLYEHTEQGTRLLTRNVASISDQAIDDYDRACIDVVMRNGQAFEYRDGLGVLALGGGVRSAKAGQGVSYVLRRDGALYEVKHDQTRVYLARGVVAIDAGTDQFGVSMVDVIDVRGNAYELSDTSGPHFLAANVRQISAGQQGFTVYLTRDGIAHAFNESSNSVTDLSAHVSQVRAGTDESGNPLIVLVLTNGAAYESADGSTWTALGTPVRSLSKVRAGVIDLIFANGRAYEEDTVGNLSYLLSGARAVA